MEISLVFQSIRKTGACPGVRTISPVEMSEETGEKDAVRRIPV